MTHIYFVSVCNFWCAASLQLMDFYNWMPVHIHQRLIFAFRYEIVAYTTKSNQQTSSNSLFCCCCHCYSLVMAVIFIVSISPVYLFKIQIYNVWYIWMITKALANNTTKLKYQFDFTLIFWMCFMWMFGMMYKNAIDAV